MKKKREMRRYKEKLRKSRVLLDKRNKTINELIDYINQNQSYYSEATGTQIEQTQNSIYSFDGEEEGENAVVMGDQMMVEVNPYMVNNRITEEAEDEYMSEEGLN